MKYLVSGALIGATLMAGSMTSAATIAVFGDRGERNVLADALVALGNTVVNAAALPGDLSGFDTIWHVGAFEPLSDAVQSQLSGFLAQGKGIYLTGERPCCDALNVTIQELVNDNLKSGSVQVGNLGDIDGPYSYNASALGNIGEGVSNWDPSAPGGILGVTGDNVLVSGVSNTTVAAAWEDSDFVNGGRLVVFMDVNWLDSISPEEVLVIGATQEFLFDGFVGPNPPDPSAVPLPAGAVLLVSALGALGLARRRKSA